MLHSDYVQAIETRLRWAEWAQTKGIESFRAAGFNKIRETYLAILRSGETFYMNGPFCQLVDAARRSIPGDVTFDASWMQAKRGWLWCHDFVQVPETEGARARELHEVVPPKLRAFGWQVIPEGVTIVSDTHTRAGDVQFCCFQDWEGLDIGRGTRYPTAPFWPWSYFILRHGDRLDARIDEFEAAAHQQQNEGAYYTPPGERLAHPLHEIRWLYTAFHLMAQRLATTVPHTTDRATRRRAERVGQTAPPFIKVVTLRRLEQARADAGISPDAADSEVDWHWSWGVEGHWRNQPTSEGVRRIWIESYIKGPCNELRPLKPQSVKVFAAKR